MNKLINDKEPLELPKRCYAKTKYRNDCAYPTCLYLDPDKKKCTLNMCVRKEIRGKKN